MSLPVPPAPSPPLGTQSAGLLLSMFQDFYRQEVAAEEDVHRTLPFFATAMGLIIAAINYAAAQLPSWGSLAQACGIWAGLPSLLHLAVCGWPELLTGVLLLAAAGAGIGVLWLLASATKRRAYNRVGREDAVLARAKALQAYYLASAIPHTGDTLDAAVAADLRDLLLHDYAKVLPANRELTLQRYHLRALAVSYLLWSLFAAIVATILILATAKFGLVKGTTL
jgi:hypothetical protein